MIGETMTALFKATCSIAGGAATSAVMVTATTTIDENTNIRLGLIIAATIGVMAGVWRLVGASWSIGRYLNKIDTSIGSLEVTVNSTNQKVNEANVKLDTAAQQIAHHAERIARIEARCHFQHKHEGKDTEPSA